MWFLSTKVNRSRRLLFLTFEVLLFPVDGDTHEFFYHHQSNVFDGASLFQTNHVVHWNAQREGILLCDVMQYIKHERQCFIRISKHQEQSWKYDAQRSIFDEIRGDWIADETLSRVFDISSQLKQRLRSKRRSKIVKISAN